MNKHNEVLALINEIKLGKQSKIEEFYFPVVTTTILTYFIIRAIYRYIQTKRLNPNYSTFYKPLQKNVTMAIDILNKPEYLNGDFNLILNEDITNPEGSCNIDNNNPNREVECIVDYNFKLLKLMIQFMASGIKHEEYDLARINTIYDLLKFKFTNDDFNLISELFGYTITAFKKSLIGLNKISMNKFNMPLNKSFIEYEQESNQLLRTLISKVS